MRGLLWLVDFDPPYYSVKKLFPQRSTVVRSPAVVFLDSGHTCFPSQETQQQETGTTADRWATTSSRNNEEDRNQPITADRNVVIDIQVTTSWDKWYYNNSNHICIFKQFDWFPTHGILPLPYLKIPQTSFLLFRAKQWNIFMFFYFSRKILTFSCDLYIIKQ